LVDSFADPTDSFLSSAPNPQKISVFTYETAEDRTRDDFADRYNEIFEFLEHQRVLGETPPLTVGELLFHLTSEEVAGVMHGLRLMYIEKPGLYAVSPIVDVTPIIILRSTHGAWLRVESGREEPMPHHYEQLSDHLHNVRDEANQLFGRINEVLCTDLKSSKLEAHYGNGEMFESLKGVTKLKGKGHYDEYLIITGEYKHYVKPEPSVVDCPHHNWGYSNQQSCAEPRLVSIQRRSTNPRSFFITGEEHHCTHRDVSAAKAGPINPYNQDKSGPRSGSAFCEIWPFEKHLCCRTCVFEEVCTNKPVFKLPCKRRE
jgi:hypothetical protein